MSQISGPSPSQPSYRSEFEQSVKLFENSFKEMQSSKIDAQRAQYLKVMRESLKVMQETANGMLNQRLLTLKDNLSKDLNAYLSDPTDPNKKQKVQSDIEHLKMN